MRKDGGNSRRRLKIRHGFGNDIVNRSFMLCKGLTLSKILALYKSFTLGKNRFVRLIVPDRFSC